ncbi:exonuclease subunit SbcD [Bifidobacterium sp. 82T24]|uniref:metallophosphoesterase family protein n=1 Tax=Bifidobacterium pluvialisilvae TaxID=2834436 RepID=UPI001C583E9C|nr:exonuclease subunit SbcD [Bifidobacterium pluvialisilvae]MBW3088994.1 exonuclease subunit SbcD [Bifidobacterium pluvialisilvae]
MRVLHTSDWHIGRRLKGADLAEYQRKALDCLVDVVRREHIDVVCVSGDVYDTPMPSASSVDILDDALTRLTAVTDDDGNPAVDVIVTPGNHDSARKLGFGAHMMRDNLHLRCAIDDIATPVVVTRPAPRAAATARPETLLVYTLPYLDPDVARPALQSMMPDDTPIPRSHEGVMTAAMTLIEADLAERRAVDPTVRAILMAHAFVSGATPSDSERNITVGGVDSVPAAVFAGSGIDYLALGHLHRAQQVRIPKPADVKPADATSYDSAPSAVAQDVPDAGPGVASASASRATVARYAGSLLAYSFSEACTPPKEGNGKSVVVIDTAGMDDAAGADGTADAAGTTNLTIRTLPVESGQPALVQLRDTPERLLGDLAERYADDWVSITVVCDAYPHDMYRRLDAAYRHPLEKKFEIRRRRDADGGRTMADLRQSRNELEVIDGFVRYTLHRDPTDAEAAVLRAAVEQAKKEQEPCD